MKFRVSLLASASQIDSAGSVIAADFPVAEADDQLVRICDPFGDGFHYIPNSDTCLKVGGYVRAESHYVDGDADVLIGGGSNSEFNNWTSRARGNLQVEARTASDIGLIRTYVEMQMTIGPGDYDDYSDTEADLPAAFIEISNDRGAFTVGHTGSFFDFYGSDDYGTRLDVDDSTTEQTLIAYTLFGSNGLRGTLSVEDPNSSGRRLNGADDYEGQELPDLVGSIKLEQEWGTAQIMGVGRHIHDVDGEGLGWAASAGFSLNLPVSDAVFSTQFGYADGAIAYLTNDPGGLGDFSGPDGEDTNQAWMARGGLLFSLTETVSTWWNGSFTHVEADSGTDEYDFWAFVFGAAWSPNEQLSLGPEFAYNNLEGDDAGEDGELWGVMWRVESEF
jgi:hypothetical protein